MSDKEKALSIISLLTKLNIIWIYFKRQINKN